MAMQDDAIQTARIHSAVHPGNRDEEFIWQNFQPVYRDLGWKNLSYEHIENFTKELEIRRDLGNRASPVHMRSPKLMIKRRVGKSGCI